MCRDVDHIHSLLFIDFPSARSKPSPSGKSFWRRAAILLNGLIGLRLFGSGPFGGSQLEKRRQRLGFAASIGRFLQDCMDIASRRTQGKTFVRASFTMDLALLIAYSMGDSKL
jgi:hypothetical protein